MSKVKDITVNYGLTANLGNYQSLRVDVGVTFEPQESMSLSSEFEEGVKFLRDEALRIVANEVKELKKRKF